MTRHHFTLNIVLNTDYPDASSEVVSVLQDLTYQLSEDHFECSRGGALLDSSGRTCGVFLFY